MKKEAPPVFEYAQGGLVRLYVRCIACAAFAGVLCVGGCAPLTSLGGLFDGRGEDGAVSGKRIPIPPTVKDFERPDLGEDAADRAETGTPWSR